MTITRKIVGSAVTEADLNALNYLASKYVELTEDILLIKTGYSGEYGEYTLDPSVNDNYTGNCILNYTTNLNDVTFILSIEWTNADNQKIITETEGNDGVITAIAPTGYNLFSSNANIKVRNGNMG